MEKIEDIHTAKWYKDQISKNSKEGVMNRKQGEQWIENGRMLKRIPSPRNQMGSCSGCVYHSWLEGDWCDAAPLMPCGGSGAIVKDLGPVNEDGCLAEERTGLFPEINQLAYGAWHVSIKSIDIKIFVVVYGDTKQEAINKWNWRA